jgi:hypothetical protein
MAPPKFGQKLVRAAEVRRYDRIFRKTDAGGELMMLVHDLGFASRDGQSVMTYTGPTYALNPSKVGEQMTGSELGEDTWTIPLSGMVHKVVPIEEAEFG